MKWVSKDELSKIVAKSCPQRGGMLSLIVLSRDFEFKIRVANLVREGSEESG